MKEIPDLSDPIWFVLATLLVFGVVVGRYLLIAGIFHLVFYVKGKNKWTSRKISTRAYKPDQFRREVSWSVITSLLFGITGALGILLWQKGILKIYTDVNQYSLWWLPASLIISLALHETYYYWIHRWMHRPHIFRLVHKVHHDSNITSAWTAFSFHPIEGLLQAIFLPALLLVLPMHLYVLLLQLTIMTISSVINHLDIEIYPKNFHRHAIGKWLIGATHHSLHHKQFRTNYGLYFTFWDKWKKTESANYVEVFEEKTSSYASSFPKATEDASSFAKATEDAFPFANASKDASFFAKATEDASSFAKATEDASRDCSFPNAKEKEKSA